MKVSGGFSPPVDADGPCRAALGTGDKHPTVAGEALLPGALDAVGRPPNPSSQWLNVRCPHLTHADSCSRIETHRQARIAEYERCRGAACCASTSWLLAPLSLPICLHRPAASRHSAIRSSPSTGTSC